MERIRSEYVVSIEGNLRERKDPNQKLPTGMVELEADAVPILNTVTSKLPFLPAEDNTQLSEEVRLKHRVLDLRYLAPVSLGLNFSSSTSACASVNSWRLKSSNICLICQQSTAAMTHGTCIVLSTAP